MVTSKHHLYSW